MSLQILLDTGPLVALLDRRDHHHDWAIRQAKQLPAPFFTCEAVLTEACYLLRHCSGGSESILRMVDRRELLIPFALEAEAGAVERLLSRYANVPMSLADACLVRLSELTDRSRILTLDHDFNIYRRHGREPIAAILPEAG